MSEGEAGMKETTDSAVPARQQQGDSSLLPPGPEAGNLPHPGGGRRLQGSHGRVRTSSKPCEWLPDNDILQVSSGFKDFVPLLDYIPR